MTALAMAAKWAVSAHFLALMVQLVLAIGVLAGSVDLTLHGHNAWLVAALGILQAVLVLAVGVSRIGLHFVAATIVGLLLVVTQLRIAWSFDTTVHVSLAMLYWGISVALLIKVWTPTWGQAPALNPT